ncbi:hypothetical protein D0865_06400 [Hortaea werneckii]|uniref:Uncharacterized protein n=1 Tax=Hortaea werneckii TaxID=91943 RepID=A0A3M7CH56_HORWE|nr:hypothetical protein D0865_06400 [Hortaea werneckii]
MFSTAGSVGDMATRHHSGSVRRWRNRSTASTAGSGIVSPSTPLHNSGRSNTMKTSSTVNCTTTTTTFLPELTSTPPMPTFQKPSPLPSPRQEIFSRENKENNLPHHHHTITLTPPPPHLPPIADPGRLLTTPKPNPVLVDGLEETPPLPNSWTHHHDRAICVLDAKGYSLHTIVSHLRKSFPRELRGSILTPAMVDKRLRVLDQDVEIDYWRVGLGLMRGGGGGGGERMVGSDEGEDVVSAATAAASTVAEEGRSQAFGSWMEEEGFRHSSASTSSAAVARGRDRARMQEPRLKTTMSGSLLKSPSIANLLS